LSQERRSLPTFSLALYPFLPLKAPVELRLKVSFPFEKEDSPPRCAHPLCSPRFFSTTKKTFLPLVFFFGEVAVPLFRPMKLLGARCRKIPFLPKLPFEGLPSYREGPPRIKSPIISPLSPRFFLYMTQLTAFPSCQ